MLDKKVMSIWQRRATRCSPVGGEDLVDVLDEQALGLGDEEVSKQRHNQHPACTRQQ